MNCHRFLQWKCDLGIVIAIMRLPQTFGSRNDDPRITRLPRVLWTLTMTVWVECGCYHTEIATAFSKPRNDELRIIRLPLVATTIQWQLFFVIARSKTTKQSINHNKLMQKPKTKRIHHLLPHSSLRRPKACGNP